MAEPVQARGSAARQPFIFVRHGETDWNRAQRYQGQRDIPLNAHGRRQATRNGRAVAPLLRSGSWRMVASPLDRSVETMRLLTEAAGVPGASFETDPVLQEISYGDWEGLTLADIDERFPAEAKLREADKWGFVPPRGESYAMLAKRIAGWYAALAEPTLVVAHGGVLRVLLNQLAGLATHDAPHLAVPQDQVILFTEDKVLAI